MRDSGLERAIEAAGGISALARAIGVAQPSVSNWSRVPAERVLSVEAVTAVSRHVLRPDLYPENDNLAAEADDVDQARGKLYLLLANLLREPPSELTLMELVSLAGETSDELLPALLGRLGAAAKAGEVEALAREHFNLFVGVGRAELIPYGSYYRTGFLYERPLVSVREDIRVLGIARGEGNSDPEDGIAFLCEAMAGMALKRFEAPPEFERRFFARHIAPWAETFFADLEKAEAATFYRALGSLGRAFIGLEREAFAIEAASDTGAQRSMHTGEDRDERQAS